MCGFVTIPERLRLSQNDLPDSPIYSSGQLIYGHLKLYKTPLSWSLLSLILGVMRRILMVSHPLKCTWIPKLLQLLLNLSTKPMYAWYYYGDIFAVCSIVAGVVGLVASSCLSTMGVVFMVEFML